MVQPAPTNLILLLKARNTKSALITRFLLNRKDAKDAKKEKENKGVFNADLVEVLLLKRLPQIQGGGIMIF
ncbi:hypothetical protein [Crinalium epipsammum]|uniref:hypothetical protein n=1 Tax=Crinalium epipsammum TaxID=241425 RepID=UPI000309F89E|nr:hypothetical protein [Crinalium epipsammum]